MNMYKKLLVSTKKQMKHASVLIVGDVGNLSTELARAVIQIADKNQFSLKVHLTNSIFMDIDEEDKLEVDLVIFPLTVTDKKSFRSTENALQHLPVDFFQGYVLIVAHCSSSSDKIAFDCDKISMLAEAYICPLIWNTVDGKNEILASQIFAKIEIATRFMGVSPSLFTGNLFHQNVL